MPEKPGVSPSRTYVAMCNRSRFDGFYFKQFALPASYTEGRTEVPLDNNATTAAWYFLNKLNWIACLERSLTVEDYRDFMDMEAK